MSLLEVSGLTIDYGDARPVVEDLCFAIGRGEAVGLIGESGSGKTQTALALMGLLPPVARLNGSLRFDGEELAGAPEAALNRIRPCRMAMVFQDPLQALNPYLTIGAQLQRIVLEHRLAAGRAARVTVLDSLAAVGLPEPERQYRAYPHQLSGGMRQRAMIAAALIGRPELVVADEPTTALDVTVQAQILALLASLREMSQTAMLLITHDLGVVAGHCARLLVLDRGRLVEQGSTAALFAHPGHARTRAMLAATTRPDDPMRDDEPAGGILLEADGLEAGHRERRPHSLWRQARIPVVRDVGFALGRGETLALVGESGSGKTSLARALVGLLPPEGGTVTLSGEPLHAALARRPAAQRRALQLVFQDPMGSLDPAMRVTDIVAEPLADGQGPPAAERRRRVASMLARVGLPEDLAARLPHELSGGQAQRVAIARALILEPAVLICDEAVAALDASVRQDILELLAGEQRRTGLALLFIAHDLGVVRRIAHRVMVMYMGRVVEIAPGAELFRRPRHPYTRALLDAMPVADPAAGPPAPAVRGEIASLASPPSGCAFHPRCLFAVDHCRTREPELAPAGAGAAACHRAAELELVARPPLTGC